MKSYWHQRVSIDYDLQMNSKSEPLPVVALVKDLMFGGKISATARAAGRVVVMLRDPHLLTGQAGAMLLADLSIPGAIEAAAAWQTAMQAPAIGFVSHIDEQTIKQAREMGLQQVMPRSVFAAQLETLLQNR